MGDDRSGFAAAVAAARAADLCVAFVGDLAGLFGHGTSGEGCDAEDLRLPGVQADLLDALLDTGTPVVVVVVSGRPYALGDVIADRAAGLVQAFMPGQEGAGGDRRRPQSGRIAAERQAAGADPAARRWPARHLPAAGSRQRGERRHQRPRARAAVPVRLRRVVHELRRSDDLRMSATEIRNDGEFTASVRVRNTGDRAGDEVVQLYLHDVVAQVARPVEAADRVRAGVAGAGRRGRRDVPGARRPDRVHGPDLRRIVEPGDFEVLRRHVVAGPALPCHGPDHRAM